MTNADLWNQADNGELEQWSRFINNNGNCIIWNGTTFVKDIFNNSSHVMEEFDIWSYLDFCPPHKRVAFNEFFETLSKLHLYQVLTIYLDSECEHKVTACFTNIFNAPIFLFSYAEGDFAYTQVDNILPDDVTFPEVQELILKWLSEFAEYNDFKITDCVYVDLIDSQEMSVS